MTLIAAWQRHVGGIGELVIASDSRLTGGMTWDCGPKVFALSRGDCALAFAGNTYYAYPLIMQLIHWSEDFGQSRSRAMDICEMKGHLERACTKLLGRVNLTGLHPEKLEVDFRLLLGGYSWKYKKFVVWTSQVTPSRTLSFVRPASPFPFRVLFIGDEIARAQDRLRQRMLPKLTRNASRPQKRPNWEPLDVLVDMIGDTTAISIGGPPQLIKVFPHMNTMEYAIRWPPSGPNQHLTLRGRPLLEYEKTQRLVHSLHTHELIETWNYTSDWKTDPSELAAQRIRLLNLIATRPKTWPPNTELLRQALEAPPHDQPE